ncbi:MAG TPA: helix-turn-helix domain-containing GNAT family N-acetyltransferase [Beijerinckiaceae bacterium]|jgi:DNA-binding MarR family transcriptional regulator/GNAT superfamily N-acetyltransferase
MDAASEHVDAVRRFTRFYTRRIGVLHEGLLGSPFSLAEGRILYEIAQRDGVTATELGKDLGLDAGYLSRILRGFEDKGRIARRPSARDGRQSLLSLTPAGREAFAAIDVRSREEVAALLAALSDIDRRKLVAALRTVEDLIAPDSARKPTYLLRPHRPGDMGWVIHRQGLLYNREYGWDETFEALVAEICAAFIKNFDDKRERCWIAESEGETVGSVFLVRQSDETAKLRLLYVEPKARGTGLGRRLVQECIRFAKAAGYRTLTLWTNDVLHAARKIYVAEGFRLVAEERHHSFGHDLVGQNWDFDLADGQA